MYGVLTEHIAPPKLEHICCVYTAQCSGQHNYHSYCDASCFWVIDTFFQRKKYIYKFLEKDVCTKLYELSGLRSYTLIREPREQTRM